MQGSDKRRPKFRPQPIARMLDGYLRGKPGVARARGLASLKIEWEAIAGEAFARVCLPLRVEKSKGRAGAVLVVAAAPGTALILQHDAPRLIERVNGYLGAGALERVRIAPVPFAVPKPRKAAARPRLGEDDPRAEALKAKAARLPSERLAAALVRLGRAVAAERST